MGRNLKALPYSSALYLPKNIEWHHKVSYMSVTAYSNVLEILEMLMSTLSPACMMDTGNEGSGLELSHIRKFGCTFVSGCDILRIRIV